MPSQEEWRKKHENWQPPMEWLQFKDAQRRERLQILASMQRASLCEVSMARTPEFPEEALFTVTVKGEIFEDLGVDTPTDAFLARVHMAIEFAK
jgi:hypothetical protein